MEFIETPRNVFDSVTNFEDLETVADTYIRNVKIDNADKRRIGVIKTIRAIAKLHPRKRAMIMKRVPRKHRLFIKQNVDAVINGYESFEGYNGYENHWKFLKKIAKVVKKVSLAPIKATIKVTKAATKAGIKATKFVAKKSLTLAKKVGKVVLKATEKAALLPLLPLKPVIIKLLKARGVNTSGMDMIALAQSFYTTIVKGGKSYEGYEMPDINVYEHTRDNWIMAVIPLVTAIVKWVAGMKKKKAAGEELTPTEEVVVTAADTIIEEANKNPEITGKDVVSPDSEVSIIENATGGKLKISNTMLYIGIAVIAAAIIYFATRKK